MVNLEGFYREVERFLSGISPESFLFFFFVAILSAFVLFIVGMALRLFFGLLIVGICAVAAYLLYQNADSIQILVDAHRAISDIIPSFPSFRYILPAIIGFVGVMIFYQTLRND